MEEVHNNDCLNVEVCGHNYLPDWWIDCKGKWLCTNCDILFGTWGTQTGRGVLIFKDDVECVVCYDTTRVVSLPNCDHFVCIGCFQRMYYGEEITPPEFPYPDNEEEIDNEGTYSPELIAKYPLLATYQLEYDIYEILCEVQRANEENLRRCPLCRK